MAAEDGEREGLLLYIWNVTHGGGRERPTDEYRVQLTFPGQAQNQSGAIEVRPNRKTLVLGRFEREGTEGFVGWDPSRHRTPGWSASVQVRLQTVDRAVQNGLALQERHRTGNIIDEVVVAFRSEFFVDYVRSVYPSYQPAHIDPSEMASLSGLATRTTITPPPPIPTDRQRILRTIHALERSGSFSKRVLDAYDQACAFCGLQLKVLDAAHIIPVADEKSTDDTNNGLALCPTHHRAFDRGILGIARDGTILLNEARVRSLSESGHGGGFEDFKTGARVGKQVKVPDEPSDAPTSATLIEGLRLRGFLPVT